MNGESMSETNHTQDAFELLRSVLLADGWEPEFVEERRAWRGTFEGENGRFWVYSQIPNDVDVLLCYGLCPFDVSLDRRGPAADLVARLNFGLRLGNLELDMDSGQIRFKTSLDFRGLDLSRVLILNLLLPCAYTMDGFLPALTAFQEGATVVAAVAQLGDTSPISNV